MKVPVLSFDGSVLREVELPPLFQESVREELIKRAVLSDMSKRYQPKGNYKYAGIETSAKYRGRKECYGSIKNMGISRLPREVLPKGKFGRVRRIPSSVKGRRAHPPKVEKILEERVNKKEYAMALRSAIAATARADVVTGRGHRLGEKPLPIVVDNSFERMLKTKEVFGALKKLGLYGDLERAKKGKRRSGIGQRKGGRKRRISALIIVGSECNMIKGGRNVGGVDVAAVDGLRVEMLAPGAHPGRLAVYTEAAIEKLRKW
jgi:large subunit ribosomal protein L4e